MSDTKLPLPERLRELRLELGWTQQDGVNELNRLGYRTWQNEAWTPASLRNVFLLANRIDDHVPHMIDDSRWAHRGRAYATGYLQALVDVVNKVPALAKSEAVPA